jgi:hypothetical protein
MALIDMLRLVLASTREGNFHSNVPPRRHSVLFCYFKMGEVFDVLISRGWTTIPYQNATWQTFPQLKYFTTVYPSAKTLLFRTWNSVDAI